MNMNTGDDSADSDRLRAIKAEYYRSVIDNVSDIIMVVGSDGVVRYVSPSIEQSLGYTPKEIMEDKERRNIHPYDRSLLEDAIARTVETPGAVGPTIELRCRHKDGSWRYMKAMGKAIRDESGRLVAVVNMLDITDRKKAEKVFQEDEERFRLLFQKSVDPSLLLDGDTFIECNEAAVRLMGCSGKAQLIGLHPFDLSPERQPDGRLSSEKAQELIDAALRKGVIRFEWVHRTFNGEDLWVDVSLTTIPVHGKGIMYTVWRDITERKHAEEALQAAHRQLTDIIEFLPDATFVIDLEKRVIAWNKAIEEMTGVKKEDMLGKGDYAYAVPFYGKPRPVTIDLVLEWDEERVRQYDFVNQEGDTLLAASYVPMTYEGKGAHLFSKASPLFDAEGHVIGAIESIRDLTEQKQTEEALRNREQELKDKSVNLEEVNAALKVLLRH